tara:strand:- start:4602 stop:5756 length:1155 start_codon:yes stop_codon:yes gene_type:complete
MIRENLLGGVAQWVLPKRAARSNAQLARRFAYLLLVACLVSLACEALIRLEMWSEGSMLSQDRSRNVYPMVFAYRQLAWGPCVALACALIGGYALAPRNDQPQSPSALPYLAWVLMVLAWAMAILQLIWNPAATFAAQGPGLAKVPWLALYGCGIAACIHGLYNVARSTMGSVGARSWAIAANVVAIAALGPGFWRALTDAAWLSSALSINELPNHHGILLSLFLLGIGGAALTLRKNVPLPARLLAAATVLNAAMAAKQVYAFWSEEFLHDTYAVLAVSYGASSTALLGLLCILWAREQRMGIVGWLAATLVAVGSLKVFSLMFKLGALGMPLSYADFAPELASMQRSLSQWGLVWLAGLVLALVALPIARLWKSEPKLLAAG